MNDFAKLISQIEIKPAPAGQEPEFTANWMIVAVSIDQTIRILAADGAFTAYDIIQGDDAEQCLVPPEKDSPVLDLPGVYMVKNLRCVDNGIYETQDGTEYDTPTYAGDWELLFDVDKASPGDGLLE